MLKEIHEQPRSIRDSMRGRLNLAKGEVVLGGIKDYEQKFLHAKRILIVGCGTSWHAGLVGEYLFEELARIPVEVEYAVFSIFAPIMVLIMWKHSMSGCCPSGEAIDPQRYLKMQANIVAHGLQNPAFVNPAFTPQTSSSVKNKPSLTPKTY